MRGRVLISKQLHRVGLLAGALFYCLSASAAPSSELGKVQGQIKAQQQTVRLGKQELAKLAAQLKQDEMVVSSAAAKLDETRNQLKQSEARIQELAKEKVELESQATKQKALLAKQAESAFRSGEHDYLKVLLNQQDPNRLSRTLDFYDYLNKARIEAIESLRATQQKITANQQASEQTLARQQALLDDQKQQHQSLLASQQAREKTRRELQKDVQSDEAKLNQLVKSEQKLKARLEALRKQQEEAERRERQRIAKLKAEQERLRKQAEKAKREEDRQLARRQQQELAQAEAQTRRYSSGLSTSRALRWPVQGPILIAYGSRRTAELKWKGTLIGAPEGSQVKAVAPGKVVYADWLDGFGMLLVVDHGKGYMSLYGHNQSLLRQVGQQVEQGEPVALVGNSGGQEQTGLYFEIRYQGEAINPTRWLGRGG
ncbi:murein hydrolase activator EnvC [Aeromonas simiae]|uniref:Peptidase M23 n=1 Tax=Aeromonas simiae TaxID=218936 RepID=A0A5J6WT57_9GAMM|nr:murein hydrolase activator EnvC [Aeromonas simiae]QFI53351.1 peptidase M23 [Aeromonas simiae]